jgi:subtilase family serine protease
MMRKFWFVAVLIALVALTVAFMRVSHVSAADDEGQGARILITQPIDESRLVTLVGNTRPEARVSQYDRGPVEDSFRLEHMFLQLKRPPQLERSFEKYIDSLTDKRSPNFRHWMLAVEQGEKYGLAQEDLDAIVSWLASHGFTVGYVYPNRMVIDFSGSAGEIREAFHTEIHYLDVHGKEHFANTSDPKIPAALAPAVVGVVAMHNFMPRPMLRRHTNYTLGGGAYAAVPADWETIYNLNPLYSKGIYGQGQTVVVVEDTNSYGTDWSTYVSTFGLTKYGGSLTTVHPNDAGNCTNPGTNSDDSEADLDVEIVSAIAPGATVELASCTDTGSSNTDFGGLIAIENLVSAGSPPAVISMSYGECEADNGASANAAYSSAFQSAAAAGVSVFVSAGDEDTASCDAEELSAGHGIGITGFGETVYNVSVGGTDFEDTYNALKPANGGLPLSTYWNSSNGPTYGSAKSYIPEIPWNDSCAGYLLFDLEGSGTSQTQSYGSSGFCNVSVGTQFRVVSGGSGGPSGCATETPSTGGFVSGTCAGYAKPSWQSGIFGNPADGVRDIPDVSLFAAAGLWGHYTVYCWSDPSFGGSPCTGSPAAWAGAGGTSISSPAMASIQALVNQEWGIRAGNPNPTYYAIAKTEFGSSGNPTCYSINNPPRRGVAAPCVFYDITQGDNVVNCTNTKNARDCYLPSGSDGASSTGAITSVAVGPENGSGYTSNPTCTIAAPQNLSKYLSPDGGTQYAGGTQATCTATESGGVLSTVTLVSGGVGYTGNPVCTISGGGGSGATCTAAVSVTTASPSYQPAFGATPGWDMATGIGSVNAYNLVFNKAW